MIKLTLAAFATLALLTGASTAQAKSIKADMSAHQVAAYCATAGANTTTRTTISVGGKSLTGTVKCTPQDLKTAAAAGDSTESEVGPSEAAENGQED
jgi:hypothetical protein